MSVPKHGTVIVHRDAQFVFANTTFCDFVGTDFDKVASHSFLEFIAPQDKENILRMCMTSEMIPLRFQLLRVDGAEVPAIIEIQSIHGHAVVAKVSAL